MSWLLRSSSFVRRIWPSPDRSWRPWSGWTGSAPADAAELLPVGFLGLVAALLVFVNVAPNTWEVHAGFAPRIRYGFATGAVAALAVMTIAAPHPFIYFQF